MGATLIKHARNAVGASASKRCHLQVQAPGHAQVVIVHYGGVDPSPASVSVPGVRREERPPRG